jgi:hypothetical protein
LFEKPAKNDRENAYEHCAPKKWYDSVNRKCFKVSVNTPKYSDVNDKCKEPKGKNTKGQQYNFKNGLQEEIKQSEYCSSDKKFNDIPGKRKTLDEVARTVESRNRGENLNEESVHIPIV